jgi:hypothetical protein
VVAGGQESMSQAPTQRIFATASRWAMSIIDTMIKDGLASCSPISDEKQTYLGSV